MMARTRETEDSAIVPYRRVFVQAISVFRLWHLSWCRRGKFGRHAGRVAETMSAGKRDAGQYVLSGHGFRIEGGRNFFCTARCQGGGATLRFRRRNTCRPQTGAERMSLPRERREICANAFA